ncbi:MAG: hypothetical protein ACKPA7_20300, partial [Sphaerospermopsis kisseleviana]
TPLREQPGCENISAEMETAVIKCLQKDPNNRFASVGELNQALQEVIKPTRGTASTINETIVQPQPDFHQETVSKPLQTFYTSESEDETILLIPQLPNQQSNNETVPRPLQPNQPQPPEGGMFQDRPSPYANNNNETVPRPLQPNQPQRPEGTIVQPQPSSEPKNHQNPANRPIN